MSREVQIIIGAEGSGKRCSASNPLPVQLVGGASTGDGAITDGVSALIRASVLAYTNAKPLAVRLTDTNGDYVSPSGGGLTDAQLRATAVPVSGPLTDAQLRAAAVPVSAASLPLPTGAATSAKQDTGNTSVASIDGKLVTAKTADLDTGAGVDPVQIVGIALPGAGGAVIGGTTTNPIKVDGSGVAQPVTDNGGSLTVDDGGGSLTVDGTVTGNQGTANTLANAWPVKVTDGTNTLPTMDAAARKAFVALTDGTNTAAVKAASTAAVATDPAAVVSLSPNSPVTAPTLTKGTQGATGFSVQELKDAGRVLKTYTVSALATVTSEALISLTPYADLVAGSAATTFAVTAGKRLRIQQIIVTVRCTSTVNVGGIVRLRLLAGTVLVASPVHASVGCMGSNLATAVAGNAQTYSVDFPDGLELSGTMQLGVTQLFSATTATIDVHVIGFEY